MLIKIRNFIRFSPEKGEIFSDFLFGTFYVEESTKFLAFRENFILAAKSLSIEENSHALHWAHEHVPL